MEKERAYRSVGYFSYWRSQSGPARRSATREGGFSAIAVTAALSAFILVGALGWQTWHLLLDKKNASTFVAANEAPDVSPPSASSPTLDSTPESTPGFLDISPEGANVLGKLFDAYTSLAAQGSYTPAKAADAARAVAKDLNADIPYPAHTAADVRAVADNSYARMQEYSHDLHTALSPMRANTQPEYEIFAQYVETKDPVYLAKLQAVAGDYRAAAAAAATVSVPADAVVSHIALLNAIEKFAATLDTLVAYADDPFGVVAVLRSYNQAEIEMMMASTLLAKQFQNKQS